MPNYKRQELKWAMRGLNLTLPPDLQTDTAPYLLNMRQYPNGDFQNRPGLIPINTVPLTDLDVHSIIRLNDYVYDEFTRVVGAGNSLYTHTSMADTFAERAGGFSGAPLSLVTLRPPRSPEPWVYVGDSVKIGKVRVDGTFYNHGVAPPVVSPYAQQAALSYKVIDDFEAVGAWSNGGTAGVVTAPVRIATAIDQIVYDDGTTGWATVSPTVLDENIQPGMLLLVGGTAETVLVESTSEAVTTTTVAAIQYVSGTTGECTIQLTDPTDRLTRDSMLLLDGTEAVRVLSVTDGPGGLPSFRCSTVGTHAAGETVAGLRSFRAVFVNNHAAAETLSSNCLQTTVATGVGYISIAAALDLSSVDGRPLTDDDEMHISIKLSDDSLLTEGRILLDVDASVNDFTRNYYYKAFRANDLTPATTNEITTLQANQRVLQRTQIDAAYYYGSALQQQIDRLSGEQGTLVDNGSSISGDVETTPTQTVLGTAQWTELRFKIKPSELIRVGSDSSRSLHDVAAIRIQLQVTDSVDLSVDAWWVGGTYGADVAPRTGVGAPYNYRYIYRSKTTGAYSNPSPPMRDGIVPRRQQVEGTVTASTDPQVDVIDIYRTGGALISIGNSPPWFYVMTIENDSPTFLDDFGDDIVIRNRQLDFDSFQPFLDTDIPRAGVCDVVGTEVTRVSGDFFNTAWPEGTIIVINSVPYTLFQQPSSTSALSLAQNAGSQTNVTWEIAAPRLMAQPLPALWGPFGTGIIEPLMLACGSNYQPGTVFWTTPTNPDGNSQFGSLQVTTPSEPLINGTVFRSQAYVFSSEALYLLTPQVTGGVLGFISQRVAGNRGLFSRYAMCVGDEGIFYLSRDGIYATQGGESVSITDEMLYPLFTHEGAPPTTVNGIAPPDFCNLENLRLIYGESCVYFDFVDINEDRATLLYDIRNKAWYYYKYTFGAITHYFEEGANLNTMIVCTADGRVYLSSGDTDNGTFFPCRVWTPWFDGQDPRGNKQWANGMLDFAGCDVEVVTKADFARITLGTQTVNSDNCL